MGLLGHSDCRGQVSHIPSKQSKAKDFYYQLAKGRLAHQTQPLT